MNKPIDTPIFTVAEFAAILGVTDRHVRNWIKDNGLQTLDLPGVTKLDARLAVAWFVKKALAESGNSGNRGPNGASEEPEETYDAALARKTRAEADLKELQLARERGEVASIADVERVLEGANKSIQTRILAMPAGLATQLLGLVDRNRIFNVLDRSCRELLTNLVGIEAVREARTAKPETDEE